MSERNFTTIAVKPNTYLGLVSLGRKNESFDDIVSKLLAEHGGRP